MNTSIPVLGWVLIIFLILFIVGINLSLFIKKKDGVRPDHWVTKIMKAGAELRNPAHTDEAKMDELADRVRRLRSTNDNTKDNTNSSGDQNGT